MVRVFLPQILRRLADATICKKTTKQLDFSQNWRFVRINQGLEP
jgi:hypothetical protein